MALLQNDKAIFYHPLDDAVETLKSKTWTGSAQAFTAGKVGSSLSRVDVSADLSGLTADYDSVAGSTKVAFCGWLRNPSGAPPTTVAPTTDSPIGDTATSASGTGVNGAAVEVFVNGGSAGDADAAVSGGTWSKTGMAALSTGDTVKARQRSTGELQSGDSNEVTVQAYSAAPTVDSPIYDAATSASGTSSEADGTVIQVYIDGTPHGSTTTVSSGTWTQTGLSLSTNDQVKARATASGKLQSVDSNVVTVSAILGSSKTLGGTVATGVDMAALDSTRMAVVYDESSPSGTKARVVTVSGTDITLGAEFMALSGSGNRPKVAVLDSSTFVAGDRGTQNFVVGKVSGTDITFGTSRSMPWGPESNATRDSMAVTELSSTTFAVVSSNSSGTRVFIGTVSGTNITFGGVWETYPSRIEHVDIGALSSTKIAVSYSTPGGGYGHSRVGAVAGTVISFGTQVDHAPYAGSNDKWGAGVAVIDSSTFVVGWHETAGFYVRVGDVAGLSISWVAAKQLASNAAGHGGANRSIALNPVSGTSKFIVTHLLAVSNYNGVTRIGEVSGASVNWDTAVIHRWSGPDNMDRCAAYDSSVALIGWINGLGGNTTGNARARAIT